MKRFTQIKGLTNVRRLPRLGKIRLGLKVKNSAGKEYPKETSYFVVPPEVAAIYGEQPTELDVMIPVEDVAVSFPQNYAYYGSGRGLKCSGDGERAMRSVTFAKELAGEKSAPDDAGDLIEVPCTCDLYEQKKCKQTGYLQILLPKVSLGGVYQIITSSYNSMVDLNSSIEYVQSMIGRVAMVPLKLRRVPTETHHDDMKQIHYTLKLELQADIATVNFLRENTRKVLEGPRVALPVPEMRNPALDDEAAVDEPEANPKARPEAEDVEVQSSAGTPAPSSTGTDDHRVMLINLEHATEVEQVNAYLKEIDKMTISDDDKRLLRKAAASAIKRILAPRSAHGA